MNLAEIRYTVQKFALHGDARRYCANHRGLVIVWKIGARQYWVVTKATAEWLITRGFATLPL